MALRFRRSFTRLTVVALALLALAAGTGQALAAKPPSFFYSDKPSAAAYKAGAEAELKQAQAALDRLTAVKGKRTIANTLVPYNEMMVHAENVAYGANLMESVHPDSVFRAEAENQTRISTKFLDDVSLNRKVYDAIQAVDAKKADAQTRYFLDRTLQEFRRSGVDRDDAARKRIAELLERLTKTGQDFDKN